MSYSSAAAWRQAFPILQTKTRTGHSLVYCDSAATTQKPQVVIDTLQAFYAQHNANIHRGVYELSEKATLAYEESRHNLARWIGSRFPEQLVLTHGATESINLVAHSYAQQVLQAGDEIILTIMEHHANIVPWQQLAQKKGIVLRYVPINTQGELDMDAYANMLNPKTKMVCVVHVSNVLGSINPVKKITEMAHQVGAKVLIDGCQACPQLPVDVDEIGCDFYVASSHKSYAPSGVGLLYAKPALLESMVPYQTGGGMILSVSMDKTEFLSPPQRFEAGTPAIAETIAWGKACQWLQSIDTESMLAYKKQLTKQLMQTLEDMPHITVYGTSENKVPIAAFTHAWIHPHDLATVLDSQGVAVRAGHHCAMPLHQNLSAGATTRASLSFYNNKEDIDALAAAIDYAERVFA